MKTRYDELAADTKEIDDCVVAAAGSKCFSCTTFPDCVSLLSPNTRMRALAVGVVEYRKWMTTRCCGVMVGSTHIAHVVLVALVKVIWASSILISLLCFG